MIFGRVLPLMEEILHQLISSLSHYFQDFIHPWWLFGISEPSTVVVTCCFGVNQITIAWWWDYSTPRDSDGSHFQDQILWFVLSVESAGSVVISQSKCDSPFIPGKICPCKKVDICIYLSCIVREIHTYAYIYIYIYICMNIHNANFELKKINQRLLPRCLLLHDWFSSSEYPRIVLYDSKDWCIFGLSLLGQHCLYCGVLDGRWTNSNVGTSKKRVFWGWWERDAMFSSKGRVRRLINVCVNEGYVDVPLKYLLAMVTKKRCLPWKHPFCIFFSVRWVELPHAGTYWALSVCGYYFPGLVYLIDFVCVWNICNYEFISWEPKRVSIYDFLHGTVDLYT